MAWTVPMMHALLLRAPKPVPAPKVTIANRPVRGPSPRGVAAETTSGYKKD